MSIKKYFEIFRLTLQEYFIYRLNFILWRVRIVINLLTIYFIWQSVFEKKTIFLNYSKEQIITYILLSSIIANFVLGTKTMEIAGQIVQGDIINQILKPVSFFKYHLFRDLADKSLNIFFSIIEISSLIIIFHPPIYLQKNILVYLSFFFFVILGTIISFFINLILSFVGFWTTEIWAPRFIYFVSIFFLSGAYFPLDILPKFIYYPLLLTPFPYLYYLPTKIYLNQMNFNFTIAISVCFFWVFLSFFLAKFIWNKGVKNYSFFGR